MSKEQFETLATIYVDTHKRQEDLQRLSQAAASIDRCDGAQPQHVRTWVRAIDGWNLEPATTSDFAIEMCKSTTSGDLLDEIRRLTNDPYNIKDWPTLRKDLVSHFLSACEEIKLQTQLETIKQRAGETPAAYIRRFRTDAARAYTQQRGASEEDRVIGAFLRGFADRHFAERLFRKGPHTNLAKAIDAAFQAEADRERMEQMLRVQGHEPMEVGSLENPATKLTDSLQTVTKALDNVTSRLSSLEKASKPNQRSSQPRFKNPTNNTSYDSRRRNGRNGPPQPTNQPPVTQNGATAGTQPVQRFQWTKDGKPICAYCQKAGHRRLECRKRKAKLESASGT